MTMGTSDANGGMPRNETRSEWKLRRNSRREYQVNRRSRGREMRGNSE